MEQFAKSLAPTRRTLKAPSYPAEKKKEMKERHSLPPFPLKGVCQLFVSVNPQFREPCWRVRFLPPEPLFLSGVQKKGKIVRDTVLD